MECEFLTLPVMNGACRRIVSDFPTSIVKERGTLRLCIIIIVVVVVVVIVTTTTTTTITTTTCLNHVAHSTSAAQAISPSSRRPFVSSTCARHVAKHQLKREASHLWTSRGGGCETSRRFCHQMAVSTNWGSFFWVLKTRALLFWDLNVGPLNFEQLPI